MRRHISNPSGYESYINVPGDLDERTFAAMVERGDYEVLDGKSVPDSPLVSRTRTTHNVIPGAEKFANERLNTGEPLPDGEYDTVVEALTRGEHLTEDADNVAMAGDDAVTTVREKLSHEPASVLVADAGPLVNDDQVGDPIVSNKAAAKKAPAKKAHGEALTVLDPLATTTDLADRNITVPTSMSAAAVLRSASAAVRDAAGCPISQLTSTVTLLADDLDCVALPSGPVTAVTSVLVAGVPISGWAKLGDTITMPYGWTCMLPAEVTVTYTHGLADVPGDIIDMICGMTAMAFARDGDYGSSERLASYRLGDYAETYVPPTGGVSASPFAIPVDVRDQLRARFGNSIGVLGSS